MNRYSKRESVENLISVIRNSHPDMVILYTQGQCYNFHLILKQVFPSAVPFHSVNEGHIYTKLFDRFYDIRGRIAYPPRDLKEMSKDEQDDAATWGDNETRRLSLA